MRTFSVVMRNILGQGMTKGTLAKQNREYCLSNYIQGKELGAIPIHPETSEQGHGQLDHCFGFGDDDRLPFEAPKPVPLPTMIPLHAIRSRLAHDKLGGGEDGRIALPLIRTVACDVPAGQALHEPPQGCCSTTPTFPVQEPACITIQSLPDPEFAPFFLR